MNLSKVIDEKCPSFAGIIAGECKGNVWYNDQTEPTLAVVYSYCVGGYCITGEIEDGKEAEAKAFLLDIFKKFIDRGEEYFEFSSENPRIYEKMFQMFPEFVEGC